MSNEEYISLWKQSNEQIPFATPMFTWPDILRNETTHDEIAPRSFWHFDIAQIIIYTRVYAARRREIYFSRFQIIRWWIDRLYRRVDRRVSSKPHTNRSIVLSGRSTDDAKCCINYSETMRDWSRHGNLSDASLLLSLNVPSPRSMAGSQTSSFFYKVFWQWEKTEDQSSCYENPSGNSLLLCKVFLTASWTYFGSF